MCTLKSAFPSVSMQLLEVVCPPKKNRFVIYVDCSKAGKRGAVMRFVVGSATMNLFLFLRLGYSL